MNIINKIIEDKYKEIESQSQIIPIDRLQGSQRLYAIRNFKQSLQRKKIDVIAEIKRKSPSENNIMMDAVPAKIAKSYRPHYQSYLRLTQRMNRQRRELFRPLSDAFGPVGEIHL